MRKFTFVHYLLLGLCCYAALTTTLYFAEHNETGASIRRYEDAIWYSLVTLTTVGYGDTYPVTRGGRAVGLFFLLGSLGVLGLLIGKINDQLNERRERKRMGLDGTSFNGHIVIIGWDDFGRSVARQLLGADRQVAIITNRKDDIDLIYDTFPQRELFVLYSELNNVPLFTRANIQEAFVVFLNAGNDTDKLIAILNLKKEYRDLRYMVTLDNPDLKDTFQSAGVTYALSKNEIASKLIASYVFEPDVAAFSNDLISSTESAGHYDIHQYQITSRSPYAGKSYGEAFWDLKESFGSLLLGIAKSDGESRVLHKLPPDTMTITVGDYLIIITDGVGEQKIAAAFGVREGIS
jgi:voltage-gated potassium channel